MDFLRNGQLNTGICALQDCDFNGLIGVETASGHWGLSTFSPDFTIVLFNDDTLSSDGYEVNCGINTLFVPHVNTDNIVHLSEHLRVTDPEQTVVDMIRYNRHEFHLYETLISAIDNEQVNIDRLNELAKQYGVYEKMYKQLDNALIAEQEDNE